MESKGFRFPAGNDWDDLHLHDVALIENREAALDDDGAFRLHFHQFGFVVPYGYRSLIPPSLDLAD